MVTASFLFLSDAKFKCSIMREKVVRWAYETSSFSFLFLSDALNTFSFIENND